MRLSFLGAAGTVTGSKYLVEHAGRRVLVDCGLFQGYKQLRLLNWVPLPFDAHAIDAVVLTHAHLDHSGALPLLMKQGYRGDVHATASTIDLCGLLLPDSGRIQEEDAEHANRHRYSKHTPALPLYSEVDAKRALKQLRAQEFDRAFDVAPGFRATLRRAGHILGAASLELQAGDATLLFSGDVGRPDDPIMREPAPIRRADYVIVESTYGDRAHEDFAAAQKLLGETIARTAARGGIVVIPAFAVGRTQLLLYLIHRLREAGTIPKLPVFLDSPMAVNTTDIYARHHDEHRLSREESEAMYRAAKMVRTLPESQALQRIRKPAVIISASGMATGGRVLYHLKRLLPDRRNTVVLAGFQAGGTRGARLQAGEPTLRIHGEDVPVRAEVVSLPGVSAHADADQILKWLATMPEPARHIYVTHGEPVAADTLRSRIERELRCDASVPLLGSSAELAA